MQQPYTLLFLFVLFSFTAYSSGQIPDTQKSIDDDRIIEIIDSSGVLYNQNRFQQAVNFLEEINPALIANDSLALEYEYRIMILYGHLELHDKLFESIIKGLLMAHDQNSRWMLLSFYRAIGSFHVYQLEDHENGLTYLKKALPYLDAVAPNSKCGLMMEIGASSLEANQLDSAKHYYDRAFSYLPDMNDEVMDHDVYSFYIPYLIKTKQVDTAEYYLSKTNSFWKDYGFIEGYMHSFLDWAELKLLTEDYNQALIYADKAKELCIELENDFELEDALEYKAKAEEKLGMIEESLASYRILTDIKEQNAQLKIDQQLEKKRIEFVTLKYANELEDMKHQNLKLEEGVSNSKRDTIIIGSVFILLSIVFGILLNRRKKNINQLNKIIEHSNEEQEKIKEDYNKTIKRLERQLTSVSLFLEKKNEALSSIKKLLSIVPDNSTESIMSSVQSAQKLAETSLRNTENWESFLYFFESVYPSFTSEMVKTYPNINQNDLRILSFIKMGLTDKEAARLQSISTASFQKAKYRLKKKLDVSKEVLLIDIVAKV